MPLNTFLASARFTPRSLGNKGRMRATCSVLSPNNWAITHLLLVLSWGLLPLSNGASLLPSMALGIRQDSGDAESGFGMDLGAGICWKAPEQGISGALRGPAHGEEDFQE